jgi:hypothetical protein
MLIYICINLYVHSYIHIHICIYRRRNLDIYGHRYVCIWIHIHVYKCVCVYSRAASETGRAGVPAMAPRRAEKAAHTWYKFDTDEVFHAPMFALNADAERNACEPSQPRSTPTEGARTFRRGCAGSQSHTHKRAGSQSHMHTRAHRDAARGRVCGAGPHRRSLHRCSQPNMDIDTCKHGVHI